MVKLGKKKQASSISDGREDVKYLNSRWQELNEGVNNGYSAVDVNNEEFQEEPKEKIGTIETAEVVEEVEMSSRSSRGSRKGYERIDDTELKDIDEEDMSGERGTYFRDGKRKIDFIIVYAVEEPDNAPPKHLEYREKLLNNLKKSRLEMEEEICDDKGTKVHFVKLHCPFEVLNFFAEELSFMAPLEIRTTDRENWSNRILKSMHLPNPFAITVPNPPPDYFSAEYQGDKFHLFIGSEDPETYFTDTERTRVVYEILETAPYGRKQKGEIGIERLVADGVFTAAYPLHVGPHKKAKKGPDSPGNDTELNERQVLKRYWGRWGMWLKYQPIHHIRAYFGEKIGLYFAWLGQYTAWLLAPSFVGLLVFLFGILTMSSGDNKPALDLCHHPKGTYMMCPRCDEHLGCKYWDLKKSCKLAMISYLFDNAATVFMAVFVSFWAVFFLEHWKRKEITLAYQWDCLDFESGAERPRPTFAALAPVVERNPITGIPEPHFPPQSRERRIYSGILVIFTMVSLVIIFMMGVIVFKALVYRPLALNPLTAHKAALIRNTSGSIANLICIMILSRVYEKVALALTHWEMHRTQTEYEDNLTFKVFVFQFVNFYASIFYIAFFKGKLIGYPGHYNHFVGLRMEECGPGGCLIELAQQLVIIMVGKQLIGNIQEVFIPVLKQWLKKRKRGKKAEGEVEKPRWEDDYELCENEGLFGEYLEMIIQFGFITIFVAAFPLAPFFALANNIFEIRIDSNKLLCETRRPIADRAQDIGVWYDILDSIAKIAVISNAFLIAFTSNFLPKLLYRYYKSPDHSLTGYLNYSLAHAPVNATLKPCRYRGFHNNEGHLTAFYWHLLTLKLGFVIIFEHFVFATQKLIDFIVPDIPEELDIAIKREAYRAKKALSDNPELAAASDDEKLDVKVL